MLKLLYPPPKTYSAMECVSVRCQTDYLSSKITVLRAWSARREVQPQREGKEHPACQRNSVFLTFFYQFYKHPLSTVRLRDGSLSYRLLLEAQTVPGSRTVQHARSTVFSTAEKKKGRSLCLNVWVFFSPLMLMRLCWNPWVRVALIVHWLFHVREPRQTFKLIIYLRGSCLPCQAAALLLVPACAPVYIFASHKANLY